MVKSARQLTTLTICVNNICQMRIWSLTNHLETTCSIFNWTMTLIRLWTQSLGIVSFVLFLYMDSWNTWCLTSRTSKILSIGCANTSWINLLMKETLVKLYGNSSWLSIILIRTVSMWTTLRYHSEIKSNPSSTHKPPKLQSTIKVRI